MTKGSVIQKSALHRILAFGLEIWIRTQCKSIEELKISAYGSPLKLLKGYLAKVVVEAKNIDLKNIKLHKSEIITGPIQASLLATRKGQSILLKEKFRIEGILSISEGDLNQTIRSEQWKWVGTLIVEKLLNASILKEIKIKDSKIEIKALIKNKIEHEIFDVKALDGNLNLENIKNKNILSIPMDPSIKIESAKIKDNMLNLKIDAFVIP